LSAEPISQQPVGLGTVTDLVLRDQLVSQGLERIIR
jgi:hypothetical protein